MTDLADFDRYRDQLLRMKKPPVMHGPRIIPKRYDLIVWLQGGWETVLGSSIISLASWRAPVLILGNDERVHEVRAPLIAEMLSLLNSNRPIAALTSAHNTKEQAQLFWEYAATIDHLAEVLLVCAPWHVVRASLTFEKARPSDAKAGLTWCPIYQVKSRERDREELAKIITYSVMGDCLPLP